MTHERDTTLAVTRVLDALEVLYCVGGSFASTVHGEERATRDVDILAALQPSQSAAFVAALDPDFYVE